MDKFLIQLAKPAVADLDRTPLAVRKSLLEAIIGLEQDPFADGSDKKKLKGMAFLVYRLRSSDYRIIYRIDQETVMILRVINRKDLEKIIKRLIKSR